MLGALFALLSRFFHLTLGVGTTSHFPPPLPPEEERQCFLAAAEGDEDARQKLILHNLRLVSHIVRKYYGSCKNQEDLISIGSIGLVKAVDTFRVENGTKFATYGAKCVQNEILMHFRAQRKSSQDVSLSDYIETGTDGAALSLMDVVSEDEDLLETVSLRQRISQVRRAVENSLADQERQVILMRYGLGGLKPCRQREVAQMLGISRSYVSRIEKRALAKLRKALEDGE